MANLLVNRERILAGTSSGLNVAAAIALGKELGPGHTVVTVAVDSGMKYLAGGLFVKLTQIKTFDRLCFYKDITPC